MGNTTSDVTNNIKAQADAQESATYKLIDVKGGGVLLNIMEMAKQTKDYKNVDEEIRKNVVENLYNGGDGEYLSIQKIVMNRSPNKDKYKIPIAFNGKIKNQASAKKVCWSIDKRGAVGETALHICLLIGSPMSNDLARRLVRIFPNIVNDIYLSDEYFGETALHLAIVNEDASMVKFLLIYGADVHQRCCGKFFCPDDQKDKRQDSITQECPILPVNTNYYGLSYFGEYPLSFAAVMHQEDCIRLLMAKGADPNKQDSNGNTVLHMLVIHDNVEIFAMMLDFGARLDIKNQQGLTPLTLAAKLARKECFTFIVEHLKTVYLIYGNITCNAYPLANIDTISEDGTTDSNSAVYLIVNGESDKHLDLLEGFVTDLLQEKWRTFAKTKFYFEILFYTIFYACLSVTLILERYYFIYLRDNTNCTIQTSYMTKLNLTTCQCYYLYPSDGNAVIRYAFEIISVAIAATYIILAIKELYIERYKLFLQDLSNNPTKICFLFACFLIIIVVPVRFSCDPTTEDILVTFAIIFASAYALYFCRGIRVVGPLVLMIHKMIKGDLVRFFLIYSVFLMGFSQAMYMVFEFGKNPDINYFYSPIDSIFNMFIMSIGEFNDVYVATASSSYTKIGRTLIIAYLVVVSTLLVNILIAMMANTYACIIESKREWQRQWAKIVLSIEQSLGLKKRLVYQKRYCHLLTNKEKALVVRRKLTRDEQKDLLENKDVFRKLISCLPKKETDTS